MVFQVRRITTPNPLCQDGIISGSLPHAEAEVNGILSAAVAGRNIVALGQGHLTFWST